MPPEAQLHTASHDSAQVAGAASRATARRVGRYALVRLLGKSDRTMAWQASEGDGGPEVVLVMPRSQPPGAGSMDLWAQTARKAARLDHPQLARAVEIGVHEGWPFIAYELGDCASLGDRCGNTGLGAAEAAAVMAQLLQALAFVHDAGLVHRDVEAFSVLVTDKGAVRLLGTEVGSIDPQDGIAGGASHGALDTLTLRAQRQAAQADVLQAGLLMHLMLTGQPALDEPDAGRAAARLPPQGRDIVRLPWTTPRPVPEPLRIIVNRATDRQERQRYRNARTMLRALEGWLQAESGSQGGPLALLLDRLRTVGVLPAAPGGAERAARLALMESQHTSELADVVLDDTALAFELLRVVNTAQLRGGQVSGNGPVMTVRRSIAMIGLDGVRRAALALRSWPGPLAAAQAQELQALMVRVRRAGRLAVAVRPAGYDAEVVYLVALLQNLGRLVVQYHFADEAAQIRRLMQPAAAADGETEEPGMGESAASMAVLGVDLEAIGSAVARWWGLDDTVLQLIRRLPPTAPVRCAEDDDAIIRATASCANEAIDTLALPAARVAHGLQAVVQRYGRVLALSLRDLQAALQASASGRGLGDAAEAAAAEPRAAS